MLAGQALTEGGGHARLGGLMTHLEERGLLGVCGPRVLPALLLHFPACPPRWALTERVPGSGISLRLPPAASAVSSLCSTAINHLVLGAIQVRSLGASDSDHVIENI